MGTIKLYQFGKPGRSANIQAGDCVQDVVVREGIDVQSVPCDISINGGKASLNHQVSSGDTIQITPRVKGGC